MLKYIFITTSILLSLGSGAKYLYDKFSSLQLQVKNLKANNLSLKKKQATIKTKIRQRRTNLVSTKLKRAKRKIAKAPLKMIPYAGAVATATFTALEIKEFCEDIKEYKSFEKSLFSNISNHITDDEKLLCGMDIKKQLSSEVDNYKKQSSQWIDTQLNNSKNWLNHKF
jgi:hypothetical protein